MKRVDAFLTGKAQSAFPESVIYVTDSGAAGRRWILDRGPRFELIELGPEFHHAKQALRMLVQAEKARTED